MSYAQIAQRLVWKETRVLWALWVTVLLLGLFFLGLMRLTAPPHAAVPYEALAAIILLIPSCFLLGCLASQFAGEREDRTHVWLRNIGAPILPIALTKLVLAAAGALLMLAVLWVVASLMGNVTPSRILGAMTTLNPLVCVEFFIISWFASVVCRSVMNAVGVSAVLLALLYALLPTVDGGLLIPRLIILMGMAVAAGVLTTLWAYPIEAESSVAEPKRRLRLREIVPARERSEPVQAWRREWQRLIWLERCYLWSLAIPCICLIALAALSVGSPEAPWFHLLLYAAAYLGGLMAFRSAQQQSRFRFFAHHGIVPEWMWVTRQVFWLMVTAIAIGVLMLVYGGTALALAPRSLSQSRFELPDAATLLMMFAIGQAMSMLIQRTVSAIVFGIVAAILFGLWDQLMLALVVPRWWSVGLIIAAAPLLTWKLSRDWLTETWTQKTKWKIARWIVGPIVLLLALFAGYRAWEIPLGAPVTLSSSFPVSAEPAPESVQAGQRMRDLISTIAPFPSRDEEDDAQGPPRSFADYTDEQKRWLDEHRGRLDEILSRLNVDDADWAPPFSRADERRPEQSAEFLRLFQMRAHEFESRGELDLALEIYLTQLKAYRLFAQGGSMQSSSWWIASHRQVEVLEAFADWMFHPEQSQEQLASAMQRIDAELRRFPSAAEAVAQDYHFNVYQLITRPLEEGDVSAGTSPGERVTLSLLYWLPWERARIRSYAAVLAEVHQSQAQDLQQNLSRPDFHGGQWLESALARAAHRPGFPSVEKLLQWNETTLHVGPFMQPEFDWALRTIINREAAIRLTRTIALITRYYHQHDKLPESLTQLLAETPDLEAIAGAHLVGITDPWTGRMFEYVPTGYPRFARMRDMESIPTNRPLVYSPGEYGIRFEPTPVTDGDETAIAWVPIPEHATTVRPQMVVPESPPHLIVDLPVPPLEE